MNVFFFKRYFSIFNRTSVKNYYADSRFRFGIISTSTNYLLNFHSNYFIKNFNKRKLYFKIKSSLSKYYTSHISFNFIFSKIIKLFFYWLIYFFNWFFNHYFKVLFIAGLVFLYYLILRLFIVIIFILIILYLLLIILFIL